jgi:hypothetical protein
MKHAMADGRQFTSYEPSCSFHDYIRNKYAPTLNNNDFRTFLQKNAEKLQTDFADCSKTADCKFCPVCKSALDYKPPNNI